MYTGQLMIGVVIGIALLIVQMIYPSNMLACAIVGVYVVGVVVFMGNQHKEKHATGGAFINGVRGVYVNGKFVADNRKIVAEVRKPAVSANRLPPAPPAKPAAKTLGKKPMTTVKSRPVPGKNVSNTLRRAESDEPGFTEWSQRNTVPTTRQNGADMPENQRGNAQSNITKTRAQDLRNITEQDRLIQNSAPVYTRNLIANNPAKIQQTLVKWTEEYGPNIADEYLRSDTDAMFIEWVRPGAGITRLDYDRVLNKLSAFTTEEDAATDPAYGRYVELLPIYSPLFYKLDPKSKQWRALVKDDTQIDILYNIADADEHIQTLCYDIVKRYALYIPCTKCSENVSCDKVLCDMCLDSAPPSQREYAASSYNASVYAPEQPRKSTRTTIPPEALYKPTQPDAASIARAQRLSIQNRDLMPPSSPPEALYKPTQPDAASRPPVPPPPPPPSSFYNHLRLDTTSHPHAPPPPPPPPAKKQPAHYPENHTSTRTGIFDAINTGTFTLKKVTERPAPVKTNAIVQALQMRRNHMAESETSANDGWDNSDNGSADGVQQSRVQQSRVQHVGGGRNKRALSRVVRRHHRH